ncbi:hypothetical protein GCM10009648_15670 [Tsukamurella spumae]
MNTTTPTIAVARRKYHQPNQVVMKETTPLITLSAVSGEASAQRAKARTEPAAAMKTRRLRELVGVDVVSAGFDVREDSESLMPFDATATGVNRGEVPGTGSPRCEHSRRHEKLEGDVCRGPGQPPEE